MVKHYVKFYPADNGDCALIKLSNGKTIIIDSQIREVTEDNKNDVYDVKSDLLKELAKDSEGRPFVDLFISTHPHSDHCVGFDENFYHGKLENYDDKKDKDKIVVGELWITPMGLSDDIDTPAVPIRQEAKRRRALYTEDEDYKGEYGSYLRIVGYDEGKEFDSRYGYVPGTEVTWVNGGYLKYLRIFIHAPFKESVEEGKETNKKNKVSIVAQHSFKKEDGTVVCKLLTGGDAEHDVWEKILENNQVGSNLDWNIFEAPHHCSWTFFNDSGNDEVCQAAVDILDHQIGVRADIVTSCKSIEPDDKQAPPPSYKAMKEYKKRLKGGSEHFRNTSDEFKSCKEPLVYEINDYGKVKKIFVKSTVQTVVQKPAPRAGMK